MSKRRVLLLVALLLALLIVPSCSTQAEPEESEEVANTNEQTETEESTDTGDEEVAAEEISVPSREEGYAGPALTSEQITIRILRNNLDPFLEELYHQWYDEFEAAHPNITIEEEAVPFGELFQKIQTVVASGDPPDIYLADGPFVKSYVYYDMLLPLDEYLTEEYMNDILPATRAEHSSDGKLYAMPMEQSALAMYFNVDMFEEAGVAPPPVTDNPDEAMTWEEAREMWQQMTMDPSGSGTPTVWGLAPSEFGPGGVGSNYYFEGVFIRSQGDPNAPEDSSAYKTWAAISPDGTSVEGYINTPEAVAGMEFYQSLFGENQVSPTSGIPSAFMDEKAATYIATDGIIGRFEQNAPDLNWSVSPIPRGTTGFTHTGSMAWMGSSQTDYPAEVAALLVWLHTPEHMQTYAEMTGHLPALISVYDQLDRFEEYPGTLFFNELSQIGWPRPVSAGYSEYQAIMDPAIKDIGLGADPAERLAQAEEELNQLLEKYR